jgi:hypothetical protein
VLNLLGLVSALVAVVVVTLAVVVTYYLRPSHGEHANPRGAATTVATLCAQHKQAAAPLPRARTPVTSYDLLCGYHDPPTVIMDLPGAPALVRPYLDNADYRRAALARSIANAHTERVSPLAYAA